MSSNRWHKIKSNQTLGLGGAIKFYVPERSFMQLTVSCWVLIRSGWGGWGEQCGNVTLPHWREVGEFINPVFAKKTQNMRYQWLETNVLYVLCFFCKICFYKFVRSSGGNSRKEWKRWECSGWPSRTGGWRSPPPPPTQPVTVDHHPIPAMGLGNSLGFQRRNL